jgi:hypothetical protein
MSGPSAAGPLLAGVGLLLLGGLIGLNPGALDVALEGPILVRLALAAAAGLIGVWYLLSAIRRLVGESGDAGDTGADPTARPFAEMVRGVRYVFLAIAAFAVGSAFVLGHPLPLIIGLIVAAVDVIETSFLLVVGGRTGTGTEG